MGIFEELEKLEKMDEQEQIETIISKLVEAGFNETEPIEGLGVKNVYYVKEDCNDVLGIIVSSGKTRKKNSDNLIYFLVDKKFYQEIQEKNLHIKRGSKGYIRCYIDNHDSVSVHKYIFGLEKYTQDVVDHITLNPRINLRHYLRRCERYENSINRRSRMFMPIREDKTSFSEAETYFSKEERAFFVNEKGFKIEEHILISPNYKNEQELSEARSEFYGKISPFCYNPLTDFLDTWYVLIYEEMLKEISPEERKKYQKEYFERRYMKAEEKDPNSKETEIFANAVWLINSGAVK